MTYKEGDNSHETIQEEPGNQIVWQEKGQGQERRLCAEKSGLALIIVGNIREVG